MRTNEQLRIERQRLAIELRKLRLEEKFSHKHFGAIVSATVTLIAIAVSVAQVLIASGNNSRELEYQRSQQDAALEFERVKHQQTLDREREVGEQQRRLELVRLLVDKSQDVLTVDSVRAAHFRDLLLVAFPPDLILPVFERLAQTAPEIKAWTEGREAALRLAQIENRIISGERFSVVLDQPLCRGDEGWSGSSKTDPLGTLKCGESYRVVYIAANGTWTVTGHHEREGRVQTHIYSNADPRNGLISLWGKIMKFDESGNVTDPVLGVVGRVEF